MKVKQGLILALMSTLLWFSSPLVLFADLGPKPIVVVTVLGADRPYWFDLLYEVNVAPILSEEQIEFQIEFDYYRDDFPTELNGYRDSEGYASYTLYTGIPHQIRQLEEHVYRVGYFSPPKVFKIAVVFDDGVVITSQPFIRVGLNVAITFDLTDVDLSVSTDAVDTLSEVVPWDRIAIQFVWRTIVTILIELGLIYLLGFRRRHTFAVAAIVNLVSQSVLTALVIYSHHFVLPFFGPLTVLFIGEVIVIALEFLLYIFLFKERLRGRVALAAVVGNLITAGLTFFFVFLPF